MDEETLIDKLRKIVTSEAGDSAKTTAFAKLLLPKEDLTLIRQLSPAQIAEHLEEVVNGIEKRNKKTEVKECKQSGDLLDYAKSILRKETHCCVTSTLRYLRSKKYSQAHIRLLLDTFDHTNVKEQDRTASYFLKALPKLEKKHG